MQLARASLIVFFTGAMPLIAGPAVLPTITVAPRIAVTGPKVYAADLLTPDTQELRELKERLKEAVVALSPLPGRTKVLDGRGVRDKLADLGITPERYILRTPDQIQVDRQAQWLQPSEIEERVRREFLAQLEWDDVALAEMGIAEAVALPIGNIELSYQRPPKTDLARPFYLSIEFRVDGQLVKRGYYRTVLTILDTVAVAGRELASSAKINPADVRWEKRPLDSSLQPPIRDVSFFEDRKTRAGIPAGTVLTQSMFVSVPLIRRGDAVTLVFDDGRIRITTPGQSLAAGSRGDRIRVMNTDSRAELLAEIVDAKTVRVVN